MHTRSKLLERNYVENFRRRSKPLESDERISKNTREVEKKEQTVRKKLENFRTRSKPRWKGTIEIEDKEHTARKRLESLKTRSKPLERK